MLPGIETVRAIWAHSNPLATWLNWTAEIKNGRFQEAPGLPETQPIGTDMYFAPGAFGKDGRRTNDNLRSFNLLWADLDDKFDHDQIRNPFPTFLWETSPGMYQAVWLLHDSFSDYDEWSQANKALTYRLGADKGGWAGSKLLRIPETYNYKRYDGVTLPKGGPVKYNPTQLWSSEFSRFTPETVVRTYSNLVLPKNDKYLAKVWETLPLGIRGQLDCKLVPDRSLHIVRTLRAINKAGYSPQEALDLLWFRQFNKYFNRPEVLMQLINELWS